jgi:signal transduction histidine kinase
VAVASFPVFALLDAQVVRALRLPWYFLCALFGAWSIVLLVRYLRQPRARVQAGPWAILGGTTVTLLLGLTDLAVSAGWLPFGPAARMSYGAPLLLCSLVYAMAEVYFRTFEQARAQAAELERRVQERTAELERTHERLLALERVATVAAERERLMRDMHDGIGSQLITTLQTVERGGCGPEEVGELLRACMDDLRLMIDSLEPDEASLQMALANLAYRLEPRLRAAGVALKWDVEDCAPLPASGATLQVLRIVQEAVSNVLKHAGASMLRLATRREEGALVLQIADDGRGFAQCGAVGTAHRGLRNMRLRAQQLQAALDIESGVGGTRLTLRMPLG